MTTGRLGLTRVAFACAGIEDIVARVDDFSFGHGAQRQARITSRRVPRRDLSGGSLFWIIRHTLVARQSILGLDEAADADGGLAIIRLGLPVIPVRPRAHRAHQGWRYIPEADWPRDLAAADAADNAGAGLPPAVLAELEALALL